MLKRKLVSVIVMCLVAVLLLPAGVQGYSADAEGLTYLSLQIDNQKVYNGIYEMVFPLDSEDTSVMPILYNDRTMLPLRAVASVLNFDGPMYYDVEWDADNNSALLYLVDASDEDFYEPIAWFQIDNEEAVFYKNGQAQDVTIPVAPTLINDRTYLPLRAIADALMNNDEGGYVTGIEWVESRQGIVLCLYDAQPSTVTFPDGTSAEITR